MNNFQAPQEGVRAVNHGRGSSVFSFVGFFPDFRVGFVTAQTERFGGMKFVCSSSSPLVVVVVLLRSSFSRTATLFFASSMRLWSLVSPASVKEAGGSGGNPRILLVFRFFLRVLLLPHLVNHLCPLFPPPPLPSSFSSSSSSPSSLSSPSSSSSSSSSISK